MAEFRVRGLPDELVADLELAARLYGQPDVRAYIVDRLQFVVQWAKREHPTAFKKQSPAMIYVLKILHAGNATIDEIAKLSAEQFDKTEIRAAIYGLLKEGLVEGRREVWATAGRKGRPEIRYHLKIKD